MHKADIDGVSSLNKPEQHFSPNCSKLLRLLEREVELSQFCLQVSWHDKNGSGGSQREHVRGFSL